jgi:hypothetical protein
MLHIVLRRVLLNCKCPRSVSDTKLKPHDLRNRRGQCGAEGSGELSDCLSVVPGHSSKCALIGLCATVLCRCSWTYDSSVLSGLCTPHTQPPNSTALPHLPCLCPGHVHYYSNHLAEGLFHRKCQVSYETYPRGHMADCVSPGLKIFFTFDGAKA